MLASAEEIRPRLLYEGVAEAIRDSIFDHRLPPGSAIDELALSRHYGVSRTPVREAIKVLVRDGLLDLRMFSGCSVVTPGRTELVQVLDVLALVDGFVLQRLVDLPRARLRQLLDSWQALATATPPRAVWRGFCAAARASLASPVFAAASRNLEQQLRLAVGPGFAEIDRELSPASRLALGAALVAGDLGEVDRLARLHHGFFRNAVLAALPVIPGEQPAILEDIPA